MYGISPEGSNTRARYSIEPLTTAAYSALPVIVKSSEKNAAPVVPVAIVYGSTLGRCE